MIAELGAAPPVTAGARRWGLPDDPAAAIAVLQARVERAGDPAGDAIADAAELSERIRTLLAPVSGLPVLCTGVLPPTDAAPDLDRDWLEIVAAVRPALARLEAHQLHHAWPAAASAPDRALGGSGPGRAAGGRLRAGARGRHGATAVALLDDWAETVPSSKHTTHAAFGFDAPRARAAQAILLAVPPDEQVALTADALPGIVLSTRVQAHARMAQPDHLGAWSHGGADLDGARRPPRRLGPGGPVTWEYYRRVEPMPPYGDVQRGFSAEVADPLWMLGRQWQVGEHAGEDAGFARTRRAGGRAHAARPGRRDRPDRRARGGAAGRRGRGLVDDRTEGPRRPGGQRGPVGGAARSQRILELCRSRTATPSAERSTGSRSGGLG